MSPRKVELRTTSECRDTGHIWKRTNGGTKGHLWHQEFICRCGTTRYDVLHLLEERLISRRYEYPDGYRVEGGRFTPRERWALRMYHNRQFAAESRAKRKVSRSRG